MLLIVSLVLIKISAGQGSTCVATKDEITNFKLILDKNPELLEQIWCTYQKVFTKLNLKIINLAEAPERPFVLPSDPETSYKSLLLSSFELLLKYYIKPENQRFSTFLKISELMIARNVKIIVETGTARTGIKNCGSDGCSTVIFGMFCKLTNSKIYSVDIDPKACKEAINAVRDFSDYVKVVTSDSLVYLEKFDEGLIDFLYLDSFDFNDANPAPSQEHHRKEIEIVYDKLHKNSIVMVDDCKLNHGGKCSLVREFLLAQGWTLLMDNYQQIFVFDE